MRLKAFLQASILMGCAASSAIAAGSDSDEFQVSITIVPACEVTADNDLLFGTQSYLDQPIEGEVEFAVQCTLDTNGIISLNEGTGPSASNTTRTMHNIGGAIEYGLYTNSNRTTYWGDGTNGSSTVTHTGTGAAESITIYAKTSPQGEPAAGVYTDTIQVSVEY